MGLTPMRTGDLAPAAQITILQDNGSALNLTGLSGGSFTLILHNTTTGADQIGAGTFSIINAVGGIIQYQWVAADTATAGSYALRIFIATAGGQQSVDDIPLTLIQK